MTEPNWLVDTDPTESAFIRWIEYGRKYIEYLRRNDREGEIEAVEQRREQVVAAHGRLRARWKANQIVPIQWLARATEDDIRAAIRAPALRKVAAMDLDDTKNVILLGPTGCGKSTTLGLCVRRYLERTAYRVQHFYGWQFPRVVWACSREVVAAASGHPLGKGEPELIADAKKASLFILDDLGLERDAGPVLDVLQARYTAGKPTWTTSGSTLEQLTEKLGEAFVRRVTELNGKPGIVVSAFPKAPAVRAVP